MNCWEEIFATCVRGTQQQLSLKAGVQPGYNGGDANCSQTTIPSFDLLLGHLVVRPVPPQRKMRSVICRLPSLLLQRSVQEQPHQVAQLGVCLPHLSDLQQLAAAALGGATSSSSSSSWQQAGCASSVRGMAGRTHKLSLKKANNKASWLAVAPYLQREQQQQPGGSDAAMQQQRVIQSAIPRLPTLDEPVLYQRIGRITGPYSVGAQVRAFTSGTQLGTSCKPPSQPGLTSAHLLRLLLPVPHTPTACFTAVSPQPCFAVMESGGSQWKVTADDVIYHNKIPGAHVNDVLEFNKVLLLGMREDTTIGRPFVPGASVVAAVEENFKDAQVRGCGVR